MPKRRSLDLPDLDAVAAEIVRLRDHGYTPRGRWNLTQMCDHLTRTMRVGLDGDRPRMPWIARKVFGVILRRAIRTRRMMAGAATAPFLVPEAAAEDDPKRIDACLATIAEAKTFDGSLANFVLMDGMTPALWRQLQTVHAQHHLSFLEPKG